MIDYEGAVFELSDQGEMHEIIATPTQTGDRYRVRTTLRPFAPGPSAHVHPGLEERFEIVAGQVGLRLKREKRVVEAGDAVVVPSHTAHRLWNPGDRPAVILAELIFPLSDPAPSSDIIKMIELSLELRERGEWNSRRHTPRSILQTAVIAYHYREAFALPLPLWIQRAVLRPLAAVGRRRGYQAT